MYGILNTAMNQGNGNLAWWQKNSALIFHGLFCVYMYGWGAYPRPIFEAPPRLIAPLPSSPLA